MAEVISVALLVATRRQYRAVVDDLSVQSLWLMMPRGDELLVDVLPGAMVVDFMQQGRNRSEVHFTAIMDRTATGYIFKCPDMINHKVLKRKLVGTDKGG